MKSLYRYASLLIATAAVAFAQPPSPQSSQPVTAGSRELFQTIARMDAKLFDAFNAHNLDAMMAMFTDDVEFYQDNDGVSNYQETKTDFTKM